MSLANLDVQNGLVNGSMGTGAGIHAANIQIRLDAGQDHHIPNIRRSTDTIVVIVDLTKTFTPGQAYVALSRVHSLEDGSIIGLPQHLSSLEPSAMVRMHMDPELERRLYQLLDHLQTTEMEYFYGARPHNEDNNDGGDELEDQDEEGDEQEQEEQDEEFEEDEEEEEDEPLIRRRHGVHSDSESDEQIEESDDDEETETDNQETETYS
ncbi:hypothetical protein BGZ88_010349, partial [Linnemannia elongata]